MVAVEATSEGISLKQSRFGYGVDPTSWHIPIIIRAQVGSEQVEKRVLLEGNQEEIDLGGTPQWAVVNAGGHGFYRVTYGEDLLRALSKRVRRVIAFGTLRASRRHLVFRACRRNRRRNSSVFSYELGS